MSTVKLALAVFLFFSVFSARAEKAAAPVAAKAAPNKSVDREPASRCVGVRVLLQEYSALNPTSVHDQEVGGSELEKVQDCLDAFSRRDVTLAVANIDPIVELVARALPFDVETSLADGMSSLISNPKLETAFQKSVLKIQETCHRDLLILSVYGRICGSRSRDNYCSHLPKMEDSCQERLSPSADAYKKSN